MSYTAVNEPMYDYAPGSQERKDLEAALKKYENVTDCPIVIGDEEIRTEDMRKQVAVSCTSTCIKKLQNGVNTEFFIRK